MLLPSGVSVEKQYIDEWLREHTTCPFTGKLLEPSQLIDNSSLNAKLIRLINKYKILESIVAESRYKNRALIREIQTLVPAPHNRHDLRLAIERLTMITSIVDIPVSHYMAIWPAIYPSPMKVLGIY